MFGRSPFSKTSFSGSTGKLYAQALSIVSTAVVTINKLISRLVALSVSVSNAVSIKKAISISLFKITEIAIVVLNTAGNHLALLSTTVSSVISINKLLSLFRTLSISVSNVSTLLKYKFIIELH